MGKSLDIFFPQTILSAFVLITSLLFISINCSDTFMTSLFSNLCELCKNVMRFSVAVSCEQTCYALL
jgi:hypothetical protein